MVNCLVAHNTTGWVYLDAYNGSSRRPGGGVYNNGTLMIATSTIISNTGSAGAGVYNGGSLTIDNSAIANNEGGWGAGVYNDGELTFNNSIIADNEGKTGPVFTTTGCSVCVK